MCAADDEVVRRFETETPRQFKNVVNMKKRKDGIMYHLLIVILRKLADSHANLKTLRQST